MSEHWKSTPRYWCKHCACYVRDTKLERQNHEATARHQGAVKRALRELHRSHEREERDKERARLEIARLGGVVAAAASAAPAGQRPAAAPEAGRGERQRAAATTPAALEAERKKQREQLAALGVAMPGEVRADMAMAGEWTRVSTRVVDADHEAEAAAAAAGEGARKRAARDADGEARRRGDDAVVRGLFKRPRRWGRDSRTVLDDDGELDALLGEGGGEDGVKEDGVKEDGVKEDGVKREDEVKKEDDGDGGVKHDDGDGGAGATAVKEEPDTAPAGLLAEPAAAAEIVFKKRKARGLRTT